MTFKDLNPGDWFNPNNDYRHYIKTIPLKHGMWTYLAVDLNTGRPAFRTPPDASSRQLPETEVTKHATASWVLPP